MAKKLALNGKELGSMAVHGICWTRGSTFCGKDINPQMAVTNYYPEITCTECNEIVRKRELKKEAA